MFDHLGIRVADLDRCKTFYVAAIEPLGSRMPAENEAGDDRSLVFGHGNDAPFFVVAPSPEHAAEPIQLALVAPTQDAVERFHTAGSRAGGTDNGTPNPRASTTAYYAAYLLDPDGNNVEAGVRARGG